MNRRFGFLGILAAAVLMMSCNNGIKEYGSVNLDTSAIARHIVQVNADYASEQEGQSFGDDEDFTLTDEEKKQLSQLLMTEVYLDIQVSTTGSVQKTEKKKITYIEMMMSATKTDAHGNSVADDLQLEIKDIPAGSTIDLNAVVAMVCTDKYKDAVAEIYKAALKRAYKIEDEGDLPDYAQYILDTAIKSMMIGLGANQKYEGKTSQPITIKAGKNTATIYMQKTDGFMAGGSFGIEFEDNKPLELVIEDNSYDDEIIIKPADSRYKFVRVEYTADKEYTSQGDSNGILNSDNTTHEVGMNCGLLIIFDEEEIILTKNEDWADVSAFFTGGNSLFIIAKNQVTGSYKTTVFAGL